MATYLKRTSKLFDLSSTRASTEVNLRDLICPVCRGILIEPVTLPCTHNLCLRCLRGTFEHNSLSCPLCRVRVGSWLRTATKSETLVNNSLWELIRTRFPKEVEGKHNGDEGDIELDSGFTSKKVILSEAGEIRREYEAQLQMAEDEMRRRRETERMVNEALIRKIQAEEQQQLAQLEQDQLLAKTLAKKQLLNKEKSVMKYYSESKVSGGGNVATGHQQSKLQHRIPSVNNVNLMHLQGLSLQVEKMDFLNVKDAPEARKGNISMISKIRADRYVGTKTGLSCVYKESGKDKTCTQKLLPIHNAVTRTLKQQAIAKYSNTSNYPAEPSCSGTQIYGTRSKEELHVPKDVLSSTKKSLGVEVCMTTGEDDERIGSAESAGSHDSINQEIHHFKPIKPMARTALKMSHDGRAIDPKLIRVLPILKRVANAVPKPPSPTHIKRILGCSWSAFRGRARQNLEPRETSVKADRAKDATTASTALLQSHQPMGKLMKSHLSDTVRRLDLAPDMSFDTNKNYAKNINRILNGTRVSKRLNLDETVDTTKVSKTSKPQANKNGTITKNKRQRNNWNEKRNHGNEEVDSSSCSPVNSHESVQPQNFEDGCTIENIAERIKRRKVNRETVVSMVVESETEPVQRSTRQCLQTKKCEIEDSQDTEEDLARVCTKRRKNVGKSGPKTKGRRVCSAGQVVDEGNSSDKVDFSADSGNDNVARRRERGNRAARKGGKSTKSSNARRNKSAVREDLEKDERSSSSWKKNGELEADRDVDTDEEVIKEQKRMERLILQEKEDFALALRLQAQFNEMERIAGRTRGSRRAMERSNVTSSNDGEKGRSNNITHAAEQVTTNTLSSTKRRRPQKNGAK